MTVAAAQLLTAVAASAPVMARMPARTLACRFAALAGREVEFEVEIAACRVVGRVGGLFVERRAAEVGVQDDAGGVDDRSQGRGRAGVEFRHDPLGGGIQGEIGRFTGREAGTERFDIFAGSRGDEFVGMM